MSTQFYFVPQDDINNPHMHNYRRRHVINSHATRHVRRQKRQANSEVALGQQQSFILTRERWDNFAPAVCTKCEAYRPCDRHEPSRNLRIARDDGVELTVQQPNWHNRTLDEQQLLVNMNTFCVSSTQKISKKAAKWLDSFKLFLQMTFDYEFLMDAALAWSAAHLRKTNVEKTSEGQLALRQLRAIQGLQAAIIKFSPKNADAIVAASVLLAWQAPNSSDWSVLVMGIKDVSSQIKVSGFRSNLVSDDSLDCDRDENIVEIHPLIYGSDHFDRHYVMLLQVLYDLFKYITQMSVLTLFSPDMRTLVEQSEALIWEASIQGGILSLSTSSVSHLRTMLSQLPLDGTDEWSYEPEELLVLAYLHALNAMWATNQDWKGCRNNGLVAVAIEECCEQLLVKSRTKSVDMQERCRKAFKAMGLALKISWMVRPFSSRLKKYGTEVDENGKARHEFRSLSGECDMKALEILLDFPEGICPRYMKQDV